MHSQLQYDLAAHDALFGLFSADRTHISLYGDLRLQPAPKAIQRQTKLHTDSRYILGAAAATIYA